MVWIYCDDRIPNLWMRKYNLPERLKGLRYIFRVDHDDSLTRYIPSRGFVARKFLALSEQEIQGLSPQASLALADKVVRNHVLAKPRSTPWISTTESWFMAVWHATELVERGHLGVHVSVLSANEVSPGRPAEEEERRFYSIDILRRGKPPALSNSDLTNEEQWATIFQQILVFGSIPEQNIIARVPIEDIVQAMPSNFFHPDAVPCRQNLVWFQGGAKRNGEIRNPVQSIEAGMRTWSDRDIGRASARLAIASLHIPPCSVRQYRDEIVSLAREVASAFSSTRATPEAWAEIQHGIDDNIREVHQEFVQAVQVYMMEELEQAQRSLSAFAHNAKALMASSFEQPTFGMDRSLHAARRDARASLVSSTQSFGSSLTMAGDILRRLTPTSDRERSAIELIIGGMQSLALPLPHNQSD